MPLSAPPPGFSWLRPTCRPSPDDVDAYAHLIANSEGYPSEASAARLIDEAELQLWTWRNEMRRRATPRRRPPRS